MFVWTGYKQFGQTVETSLRLSLVGDYYQTVFPRPTEQYQQQEMHKAKSCQQTKRNKIQAVNCIRTTSSTRQSKATLATLATPTTSPEELHTFLER